MQLSEENLQIGYALIDNINENGFLTLPLEDIYNDDLENNFDNDADESLEDKVKNLEWILHLIQKLDPEGVGSRNAEEFIALQLQSQPKSETQKLALKIVQNDLRLLSEHRFPALMKKYRLNKTQFKEVFSLIKNLRPSPLSGTSFEAKEEYIHPDVLCYRDGERWDVTLNQHNIPKIGINQAYSQMVKTVDQSDTQAYIKSHLQEARWFIKSIESRNQTLLKVAKYIVDFQQDFLDHGEQAMKPMILHDVAEAVEMHESTISRITTRKYMHTPRGIFELKYFFSSHLETDTGMHCSTTAIKAQIKKLISEEPANQPYSDDKLVQMLSKQGIKIARRTIAKYRELMNIPSSAQRKRKNWTQS